MDEIERVARAIFDTAVGLEHWHNPWHAEERDGCLDAAKAAIAALRSQPDPRDKVVEAARDIPGLLAALYELLDELSDLGDIGLEERRLEARYCTERARLKISEAIAAIDEQEK